MMLSLEQLLNKAGRLSFRIFTLEDKKHRGLCLFWKEHTEIRADQMGLELTGEAVKITKEQAGRFVWEEMCHLRLSLVTHKACVGADLPHNGQNGVMKIEVVGYA